MIQPKISIIVPVHNAGSYLEKCLKSLVTQTLQDIEIILVIDCPTDGSNKVAEAFASKDRRIVLIYNTENLHTGLSRNKGIQIAKGKYIGFQDHDDYCEATIYEKLYIKAEQEQLDVVRCNFYCVYTKETSGIIQEEYKYPSVSTQVSHKEWIYEYVCGDKVSCVIWNHIYRRDFLKKNNIQFLDSRRICSEDSIFFMQVYHNLAEIGIISDYLYYHVFHSTNTGKVYEYRSVSNRIAFFEGLYSFLIKNGISDNRAKCFLTANLARSLYSASRQALMLFSLRKALDEIRLIRTNSLAMSCIKSIYAKENRKTLKALKPTIVVFFFILRLFS